MPPKDLINKQIGGFTIVERIGRGGMATVYRAHQTAMNRDVALKVIELDDLLERSDEFRTRFDQEAAVIAKLEHIHILPVYDYGIHESILYLAMRMLSGGTLSEMMNQGQIPIAKAVELFSQVARGLAYAHSKGVIHRDLKPSNIMLDDAGNAHLTDFGLAKWIHGAENITRTGNIVGTPAYMSPEQLRGEAVDHRSDIYSMGVILYQMLTGKPPFESKSSNVVSVIYQHLEKSPEAPSLHNPDLPPEVEAVIMRALEKDPKERFQSMGEMVNALRTAIGLAASSTSYPAVKLPSETTRKMTSVLSEKPRSNLPFLIIGGMFAGMFLIGVVLFSVMSGSQQNNPNQQATEVVQTRQALNNLQATILVGESGTVEDTIPSDEELAIAKTRIGDGFIAIIACNRTSEYHAGSVREMGDFLREYGIASRIYDSENNENRQPSQIEQARSDGAVGFIICPLNANILDETLRSLDRANYPLTMYSGGEDHFAYGGITTIGNDYELGYKPGQFAGQIIADEFDGEARVIILDYPELQAIVERADGLEDGVLSMAPDATIVGRYLGATPDFGRASIERLLADGVEFDVIVSINDAGSIGAIEAMEAANIPYDQVVIVSIDADSSAREAIRRGRYMRASVEIDRTISSKAKVDALIRIFAGGTLPEQIFTPPGDMVTAETLSN